MTDDEPPPIGSSGDSGSGGGADACLDAANEIGLACIDAGLTLSVIYEAPSWNVLLVEDPSVRVAVAGGYVVVASTQADYVAWQQYDGGSCGVVCGWCQIGQSLCTQDFNGGVPQGCTACIAAGTPDPGDACEAVLAQCEPLEETSESDGGSNGSEESGGSIGSDDDGLGDETSNEDIDPEHEYDCDGWEPSEAVTIGSGNTVHVDVAVVQEVITFYGEPLAECDGTLFSRTSTGHFAVVQLASGGLLHALGLRVDDILLEAEDVELDSVDAIADLVVDLFYDASPASSFTLTYRRGSVTRQLNIELE